MSPSSAPTSPLAQAVDDLFRFAIDREDVKWSLARLPESCPANPTTVEYELQALKIVTVGWSLTFCLAGRPHKQALQNAYWQEVQTFAQGLSKTTGLLIGQDIDYFQTLRQCLDHYLEAMTRLPDGSEPAQAIGPAFARRCQQPGDLFTEATGARMFQSAVHHVRAYLQAVNLVSEDGPRCSPDRTP